MAEQGGVGVHHALRGAGRARRVHDGQRIRIVDVVFHRLEQRGVDHVVGFGVDQDVAQQRRRSLNVGKPRPVVVGAERCSGKQDFGVAVDELFAISGAVAKVENGMTTAPIRAAASMPTTNAPPLG